MRTHGATSTEDPSPQSTTDWKPLIDEARAAREHSYSPYSRFKVGAALRTRGGALYRGTNVENRSFGLTLCAERSAIASAVADGHREFEAVVVYTETSPPALPCGLCLEALTEFCRDLPILATNPAGERRELRLRDLHPKPFEWPPELADGRDGSGEDSGAA